MKFVFPILFLISSIFFTLSVFVDAFAKPICDFSILLVITVFFSVEIEPCSCVCVCVCVILKEWRW